MKSPLSSGTWLEIEEVESTQDVAAAELLSETAGVVFAHHQTVGRGRFRRNWVSQRGDSLTLSLVFRDYADHPKPYLVGMTVAVACAAVLHCELSWPNDLVAEGKKLGGILTELLPDASGKRVPVVGVGINLNQKSFPDEIKDRAVSVALYDGGHYEPIEMAKQIIDRLARMPEPREWTDLAPVWMLFDHTPGKSYRLPDGQEATALGIGPEGQLICSVNGETMTVFAADAILGRD